MLKKSTLGAMSMLASVSLAMCSGPVNNRMERPSRVTMGAPRAEAAPLTRPVAHHRVVRVRDGDSLTLESDGVTHEVRLSGIDAPELSQNYGPAAKAGLAEMVQGRLVTFTDSGQDKYHRNLVHLYVDGVDVNLQMVGRGLAWHYHAYSQEPRLATAEQDARAHHRGLWSQPNPVPPWDWRHRR